MPFATEQDIRDEAFMFDEQAVESERLQLSLEKAHQEILQKTTLTDDSPVTDEMIRAESILTLAHYFRSIAIAQAITATKVHTSTLTIDEYAQVTHWLATSNHLWHEAWQLLRPYWVSKVYQQISVSSGGNS